jgi:hypothetical protein
MQVGLADPGGAGSRMISADRQFNFGTPPIDRLVVRLFKLADLNPPFFNYRLKNEHAGMYFALNNATPLVAPD